MREEWPALWARYRRNDTLTAWLRLPLLVDAAREPVARPELLRFAQLLPAALRGRRPAPTAIVRRLVELGRIPSQPTGNVVIGDVGIGTD